MCVCMYVCMYVYTHTHTRAIGKVRGLNYSESELCGGAVTVSIEVPPLASDVLLTTLRLLLENVLQTVGHFEISCLGVPFSWLEKPRHRMGRDLDCMADVLMGFHRSTFPSRTQNSIQVSLHATSGLFQLRKGSSEARNFEVMSGL
jgi:hypothetical protein